MTAYILNVYFYIENTYTISEFSYFRIWGYSLKINCCITSIKINYCNISFVVIFYIFSKSWIIVSIKFWYFLCNCINCVCIPLLKFGGWILSWLVNKLLWKIRKKKFQIIHPNKNIKKQDSLNKITSFKKRRNKK